MAGEVKRRADGTLLPGSVNNPLGKPKATVINELKSDMEIALRKGVKPERVQAIIEAMLTAAEGGDIRAAKLIMDKFMSNASQAEPEQQQSGGVTFVIKNLSVDNNVTKPNTLEVEYEEIEQK